MVMLLHSKRQLIQTGKETGVELVVRAADKRWHYTQREVGSKCPNPTPLLLELPTDQLKQKPETRGPITAAVWVVQPGQGRRGK